MSKHSNKGGTKKVVLVLLVIIAICSTILYIKVKADKHLDDKEQEKISQVLDTIDVPVEEVTPVVTERQLQVMELQQENSEVVGWLEIEGTNINYPVCQAKDNDYYLTHTYKKEKNVNGSLFLDKDYDFTKPSSNLLIYGHRNKKGLMFDELIKYKQESFYKEHQTIRFTTAEEDAEYEIISAFKSRVYYQDETDVFRYYYFVDANNRKEYDEFVTNAKKASLYDTGVTAEYGDQLITLSTCDYEVKDGRFAVVAKKIER